MASGTRRAPGGELKEVQARGGNPRYGEARRGEVRRGEAGRAT